MLRTEFFSIEQRKRHALSLTGQHRLDVQRGPDKILPRPTEHARVLLVAYDLVAAAGHIANIGVHVKPVQRILN